MRRVKNVCALLFLHVLLRKAEATSLWGGDPETLFGSGGRLSSRWTSAAFASRETKREHVDASRRGRANPFSLWLRTHPQEASSITGATAVGFSGIEKGAQSLRAGSFVRPFVLASSPRRRSFRASATMTTTRDSSFVCSSWSYGSGRISPRPLVDTGGGTLNRYSARRRRLMLSLFEGASAEAERYAAAPPAPATAAARVGAVPAAPNNASIATASTPAGAYPRPEIPSWRHKAVIIPGFATDARAFEQLCHRLERRGIASVVVPIRWYHWLPTLGGRSVRPILDRVHETIIRCVHAKTHQEMPYAFNEPGLQNKVAPYSLQDFLAEMEDPKRGAHHMGPLDLPVLPACPTPADRVIIIAHSAGGWMSRIYLSEACYDGRVYNGSSLASGLVTLGTPHVRLDDEHGRPRELPFSRNFKFVEDFCTGDIGGGWEERTPTACVGGAALRGRATMGGLLKDLAYQSYELCCGDGTGVGDGITPLESAFDMADAKCFVELEGVYHAAGLGGPWYGSDEIIDSWLRPALDTIFGSSTEEV